MADPLIERILRQTEVPELLEILTSRLALTDLQSLLLAVYKERARTISPSTLLKNYRENRLVQPASLDPGKQNELERLALELLPSDFHALELAPVCPLGTNSALAPVDQNNAVTTIRNTEVVADSTNVMALECASRRKAMYQKRVSPLPDTKLFANHRLLRSQFFKGPFSLPHFRILSLVSAGRDQGSYRFESTSLYEHIAFYVRLFLALSNTDGASCGPAVSVTAFNNAIMDALKLHVLDSLANQFPGVSVQFDQAREHGRDYYTDAAFDLPSRDASGKILSFADGGTTSWMRKLLSNSKERFVISGAGSERLLLLTGQAQA